MSILVVTVAEEELLIVTLNSRFELLITPSNVPNIDPVAPADSSTVVTFVPSCIQDIDQLDNLILELSVR